MNGAGPPTSRRALLGALSSVPLAPVLPVPKLAFSTPWESVVTAYYAAETELVPYQEAFHMAELRIFNTQAPDPIDAEYEYRRAEELYGKAISKLAQVIRDLLETPAPSLEAIICKVEIAIKEGEYPQLPSLLLADLRGLKARHVRG